MIRLEIDQAVRLTGPRALLAQLVADTWGEDLVDKVVHGDGEEAYVFDNGLDLVSQVADSNRVSVDPRALTSLEALYMAKRAEADEVLANIAEARKHAVPILKLHGGHNGAI